MTQETQASVARWAEETFGPAEAAALVARARLELDELEEAARAGHPAAHVAEEAADVLILLYRIAERSGEDLLAALDRKMSVNRQRRWARSGDGTGRHV